MQKEPLASAVILTYNQEQYIAQAIECALAQRVDFPYEIVIGEDCSTDRTRKICLQYQEKYSDIIRVITSKINVGLIDNWYRSVKAARGKYIAGCGGDDFWHNPDKMQKQVQFLEENPDYGMVHSDFDYYYQNIGKTVHMYLLSKKLSLNDRSALTLEMFMGLKYPIKATTAMFKKDIFDDYYNIEEIKKNKFMMEDTPLYIEIAANSSIHFISESLATYRELSETVSRSDDKGTHLRFWISDSEMYLYYCKKYSLPDNIRNLHENIWKRRMLQLAFYTNDKSLAELVKRKYSRLCIKDLFWYWGSRNQITRYFVKILIRLRRKDS